MKLFSFRRFLRPALSGMAGAVVMLALSGCEIAQLTLDIAPDEGGQGETMSILIRRVTGEDDEAVRINQSTAFLIDPVTGDPPERIAIVSQAPGEEPNTLRVSLRIEADAPTRPIAISITPPIVARVLINRPLIFIHREGAALAPRIEGFSPDDGVRRGRTNDVVITAQNLDPSAQLVVHDPAIIVAPGTTGAGRLNATLDIPVTVPVGLVSYHVETAAGSSEERTFKVLDDQDPPRFRDYYPNYGRLGEVTIVTGTGERFAMGSILEPLEPGVEVVSQFSFRDRRNFTAALRGTEVLVNNRAVFLDIVTLRGSTPSGFHVVPSAFQGPRIRAVTPQQLVGGTQAMLLIECENMATDPGADVDILPNDELPTPMSVTQFFGPSAPGNGTVVAKVGVTRAAGRCEIAVATQRTFSTNSMPVEIILPPPDKPLVTTTQVGTIARGTQGQQDRAFGERLAGASAIVFEARGLRDQPALSGLTATIISSTDTHVVFSLNATSQAPLTGDFRTFFKVLTSEGWSNEAAYIVTDETVEPPRVPRIDFAAPNFIYPGQSTILRLLGENFVDADGQRATVSFLPPGAAAIDPNVFMEVRNESIFFRLIVNSPEVGTTVTVEATHPPSSPQAGTGSIALQVLDPASNPGPILNGINTGVIINTVAQIRLTGSDFGFGGPTSILSYFDGDTASEFRNVRFFSPSNPQAAQTSVVLQFEIAGPALFESFNFAVNRNGLISNEVATFAQERPTDPEVTRTSVGEIRRPAPGQPPTQVNETIFGKRLTNVAGIAFDDPNSGITVTNVVPNPDGLSITATFTAAANAVLTGDAVTTFRVLLNNGARSNAAGYIVLP